MTKTSTIFLLIDNRDPVNAIAVGENEFFDQTFNEFTDVIDLLGKQEFEPKTESINRILDYAKTH